MSEINPKEGGERKSVNKMVTRGPKTFVLILSKKLANFLIAGFPGY